MLHGMLRRELQQGAGVIVLQGGEAIEAGSTVVIGYVENHGARSDRVVDPVRLEGGSLTAHEHRDDDLRAFAEHRIT